MQFDKNFVSHALQNEFVMQKDFFPLGSFSVDTRTLHEGDIFVALKGQHVDGHDFIGQALEKKVAGLLIAQDRYQDIYQKYGPQLQKLQVLVVHDTLQALVQLATQWRLQFYFPVIAVTGSVGKTSTKEMIAQVLRSTKKPFYASRGNQNTLVGVALNILNLRQEHSAAVFEVGIGRRGSMKDIVKMLAPTYALITHIGHSHMEGIGSLQDVAIEKRDIFHFFSPDSIGIINGDDELLSKVSYPHPVIRFGYKTTNQIQARKVMVKDNMISCTIKSYQDKAHVMLSGSHQAKILHVLAALAVGHLLNIPFDAMIEAVQKEMVVPGRFQTIDLAGHGRLINDCYNANPESMKAGLLAFGAYCTERKKILVLGDMRELGVDSIFWHRQIGRFLHKIEEITDIILIGNMVQWIEKTAPIGMHIRRFATWQDAYDDVKSKCKPDTVLFLKASNSVGLQALIEKLHNEKI